MDAITCKCPTCGAPIAHDAFNFDEETRTFVANGVAVRFTKHEAWIVRALWNARRKGGVENLNLLAAAVYGHDPDGGPDNATIALSVMLIRIRAALERAGYTITKGYGRPKRRFQIVKSEDAA